MELHSEKLVFVLCSVLFGFLIGNTGELNQTRNVSLVMMLILAAAAAARGYIRHSIERPLGT